MKETKTVSGTPEARAVMHEMMAAFEAIKKGRTMPGWTRSRRRRRLDAAVGAAQARLDRVVSEGRRPELGLAPSTTSWSPSPQRGRRRKPPSTAS
jgi:hypothetical protein